MSIAKQNHMMHSSQALLPLRKTRFLFLLLWSFLVLLQALLWPTPENIASNSLSLIGGLTGTLYTLRRILLRSAPVSSTMLMGYTAYYFLLPPVATLAEWKPLTNNLDAPILVHVHALIGLASLLVSHSIYCKIRHLQYLRLLVSNKVYRPLGFFAPAGNLQLILMGLTGLMAMGYQIFVAGSNHQDVLGTGNKIIQAMYPLAYLPFCILLKNITSTENKIDIRWLLILAGYFALLLILSMARNARSAFLIGIMSIAICYGYGLAAGLVSKKFLKAKYLVSVLATALLLIGPVSDLATSMVIVRAQKSDTSPMQLLEDTIKIFGDKSIIRDYRLNDRVPNSDWDEHYTENIFMARLSNLKFTDNSLVLAYGLDAGSRAYLWGMELQKVLAIFPRPMLDIIAPWVDKDLVGAASGGDLMLYAATNNQNVLGGFRTGSLLGSSYALFGWFYPLVLILPLLPLFVLADAQTTTKRNDQHFLPILAPMVAVTFFTWFYFLTSAATGIESFSSIFGFLFRGWVQVVLIYAVIYWMTNLITRVKFSRQTI